MSDWNTFVKWEIASRETIDFKMIYVDIAGGDILAGLLLSQIVYWNLPGKDGRSKLRVQKENKLWLARKHSEWHTEIRMSEDQVRRALKVLQALQLVEVKLFKFDGAPTNHICLNRNVLAHAIKNQSVLGCSPDPFGPEPNSIWEQTQIHLGYSPEPLTETTYKDYNKDLNTPFNPPQGEASEIKQISLLPVLVEPKTVTPKTKKAPKDYTPDFERFWDLYPEKESKAGAFAAWKKINPSQDLQDTILKDVALRRENDPRWLDKYIPFPARYLKERRWESPIKPASQKPKAHMSKHERNQAVLDEYFAKKGIKTNGLT
jgi:hypothetical protein